MRKNVERLFFFWSLLFLGLLLHLGYWQILKASQLMNSAANKRSWLLAEKSKRGTIFDRNKQPIVWSEKGQKRLYTSGLGLAQTIGYNSRLYGRSGLEDKYNEELAGLGRTSGDDLILTLDSELQRTANLALGSRNGAVVVLQPKTGEILALVSHPVFSLANLAEEWKRLNQDTASPLLNRALHGLYPPGSTMKPLIAAAALETGTVKSEAVYNCRGYQIIDGRKLSCNNGAVHGRINLEEALTVSCNSYFSQLGVDLGQRKLDNYLHKLNWSDPKFLRLTKSRLADETRLSPNGLAERAIGQGKLQVTPFYMANLAAVIANDGLLLRPYLVSGVEHEGRVKKQTEPAEYIRVFQPETAKAVKKMMLSVVERGTGKAAFIPGLNAAGKTGSAQNPNGPAHAWFIGFAPANDPKIAVAVLVEHGGSGGGTAAPIAREIIAKALDHK